jgi:hypothetical protein
MARSNLAKYDRIVLEFKDDCLKELGIEEHPRADAAFDTAWEMGQENLSDVFEILSKLTELMVPRNPITGWLDVAWVIKAAASRCSTRKDKHAAIKAAITDLIDALTEPGDDD